MLESHFQGRNQLWKSPFDVSFSYDRWEIARSERYQRIAAQIEDVIRLYSGFRGSFWKLRHMKLGTPHPRLGPLGESLYKLLGFSPFEVSGRGWRVCWDFKDGVSWEAAA